MDMIISLCLFIVYLKAATSRDMADLLLRNPLQSYHRIVQKSLGDSSADILLTSFDFESVRNVNADELQYHGTTTLAFINHDAVIVCVDSKASMGSYVGSRDVKKVFPIADRMVATMAGGAADCAHWIRRVNKAVRVHEFDSGSKLRVSSVARLFSSVLRKYRQTGISVASLVAGYDATGPSLHYVDSDGVCVSGDVFCVGSGASLALSILDSAADADADKTTDPPSVEDIAGSSSRHTNTGDIDRAGGCTSGTDSESNRWPSRRSALVCMDFDSAVDTAVRAVRHATVRDSYSGGFINVLVINATGTFHIKRIDSASLRVKI